MALKSIRRHAIVVQATEPLDRTDKQDFYRLGAILKPEAAQCRSNQPERLGRGGLGEAKMQRVGVCDQRDFRPPMDYFVASHPDKEAVTGEEDVARHG